MNGEKRKTWLQKSICKHELEGELQDSASTGFSLGEQHRIETQDESRSCFHQPETQQWYNLVTHTVYLQQCPHPPRAGLYLTAVLDLVTRHGSAGLSCQTWFLGLRPAQGFSVAQFLYKEEKVQVIFFCMCPLHFQVAKVKTQTGLVQCEGEAELACASPLREKLSVESNYLGE